MTDVSAGEISDLEWMRNDREKWREATHRLDGELADLKLEVKSKYVLKSRLVRAQANLERHRRAVRAISKILTEDYYADYTSENRLIFIIDALKKEGL